MGTTKEILKEIREREKMTQTDLGEAMGFQQVAISYFENGREMRYSKLVESLAKVGYILELKKVSNV